RADADLQPEGSKAPAVEALGRFHELADGGLHRQEAADADPVTALSGEELVHRQADRLAGDVVERVRDGRLRVERVVERLVQGGQDPADVERRPSDDQRLEVILDGAHEAPQELGAALAAPRLRLADPDDAFVGVHTHDQGFERLARALRDLERLRERQPQRDRLDLGDLHGYSSSLARKSFRVGPHFDHSGPLAECPSSVSISKYFASMPARVSLSITPGAIDGGKSLSVRDST